MLASPHDTLFKALFSQPRRAAEVLRSLLPPAVARRIDWPKLVHEPGSFVDEALRGSHADLLFSTEMAGRAVKIYLLLEHQSTYDRCMPRRLLRYMDRIWDTVPADASVMPVIFPVVIHHGKDPWPGSTDFHAMFAMPPTFAPFVPKFRFVLFDLAALDPALLHDLAVSACVRLTLLVLQSARSPAQLDELLLSLRDLIYKVMAEPFEDGALRVILRYILETRSSDDYAVAMRAMSEIDKHHPGGTMDTIAAMLRREGEAKGEARGEARGQRSMLLSVIQQRLGGVPDDVRTQIEAASDAELQVLLVRALRSSSIDELRTG